MLADWLTQCPLNLWISVPSSHIWQTNYIKHHKNIKEWLFWKQFVLLRSVQSNTIILFAFCLPIPFVMSEEHYNKYSLQGCHMHTIVNYDLWYCSGTMNKIVNQIWNCVTVDPWCVDKQVACMVTESSSWVSVFWQPRQHLRGLTLLQCLIRHSSCN